jgi:3-phosphoshikimate 1-carboxyvinyltransferase
MLSSLAEGRSVLRGLLLGEDVLATVGCFREMGVRIDLSPSKVEIHGVGLKGLKPPDKVLDCGNSGTTLRLMMGLLAGQPFDSRLTGDASLNRRPIERVAKPLREMGAQIEEFRSSETERIVKVSGRPLKGISYKLPMASAQVKSAILLAGLFAKGKTEILENIPSRDHTEIMLSGQGVLLQRKEHHISLEPSDRLHNLDIEIPGDISSAAFFLVAGSIGKNSEIVLKKVGVNPTRTGILEVLQAMGADLQLHPQASSAGEKVADIKIRSSALKGIKISGPLIPRLIDEIPILMVAAAAAKGSTEVRDAGELRVKESDRIEAIERELKKLGTKVQGLPDGLILQGGSPFSPGHFQSGSDHRIAMSMTIAATQASGPSQIEDVACIDTSYPDFFDHLKKIGGKIEVLMS